ncbi:tRNA-specific adenosine deaminase, partial [Staphylococcus pseudintermedius]|uniref:deaminase n=1 Tax=Staphylococcus pseudintermedius TaxID=283734 RepID=UPI000E3B1B3D
MKSHQYNMSIAIEEAIKAAKKGIVPIGSIVVKNETIRARANYLRDYYHSTATHAERLSMERSAARLGTWLLEGCT